MAIKTVTVRKGDVNKELEVQKLIKEGFIITNENLKKVFNDYENINLDEMIQQYKIACSSLEHEESIRERINKIKVEWESKLIDIVNDILSNISTMEDRVSINKAIAVVTYKRLVEMKKLSSDMDIVKRLGIITSIIDDFRELVNIDAEILKSALIENDTILNKTDWTNIIKGGLLYPEYPCSMINHKNTIVDFIVYVITVDASDEV